MMFVCFVRHNAGGPMYLFDCTGFEQEIRPCRTVQCDTMHGYTAGYAVTYAIEVSGPDKECVHTLLKQCGAYFPLKKIVGVQMELSDVEKERIAREWLAEKLGDCSMPF